MKPPLPRLSAAEGVSRRGSAILPYRSMRSRSLGSACRTFPSA
jgi:hypothetical protein